MNVNISISRRRCKTDVISATFKVVENITLARRHIIALLNSMVINLQTLLSSSYNEVFKKSGCHKMFPELLVLNRYK
jgi:hypothetical protein